jgi:hypothetical protein
MKGRRDWTAHNTRVAKEGGRPSPFARWVSSQLETVGRVVEVGCGAGLDLPAYAAGKRRALGLDYALARRSDVERRRRVTTQDFSLDDLRDVLTLGAVLSRYEGEQAVVARHLLEALTPDSTDAFFYLCSMGLRRGGRAYLEGVARTPRDARAWQERHETGRIRSLDPARVAEQAEAGGGRILSRAGFDEAAVAVRTGPPARWRMTVEWGPTAGRAR